MLPKGHPKKDKFEKIVEGFLVEKLVQQYFESAGKLNGIEVYTTKEEAIKAAKKAGISGYHEHEKDGKIVSQSRSPTH